MLHLELLWGIEKSISCGCIAWEELLLSWEELPAAPRLLADRLSSCLCCLWCNPLPALSPFLPFHVILLTLRATLYSVLASLSGNLTLQTHAQPSCLWSPQEPWSVSFIFRGLIWTHSSVLQQLLLLWVSPTASKCCTPAMPWFPSCPCALHLLSLC